MEHLRSYIDLRETTGLETGVFLTPKGTNTIMQLLDIIDDKHYLCGVYNDDHDLIEFDPHAYEKIIVYTKDIFKPVYQKLITIDEYFDGRYDEDGQPIFIQKERA